MVTENKEVEETKTASEEKHYDEPVVWQPYGGAVSFEDVDTQKEAMEYTMHVDMITDQLRGIVHNITNNEEMDADEKARSIQSAASEFRTRINEASVKELENIKAGKRMNKSQANLLQRIAKDLKGLMHWANYEDDEDEKMTDISGASFKIFKDKSGNYRWLSFSSNAFEDLEKELFSTKALEEAVEHGDKTGERGPLLIYHVPSAEIGQCDFQAVVGRFLLESGTFDNTPMGNKALEYFVKTDEEHQVSIGYTYQTGDEKDGVYDWLRVRERSVCPAGAAANPWTDFKVIGGSEVDERKVAELKKIFGDDLANEAISKAEQKSKDLEGSVKYKAKDEDNKEAEQLTAFLNGIAKEMNLDPQKLVDAAGKVMNPDDKAMKKDEKKDEDEDDEEMKKKKEAPAELNSSQVGQLASLVVELSDKVDELIGIKDSVEQLQKDIKDFKASDDEKIAAAVTPRLNLAALRSVENGKDLDEDKVKELIKNAGDEEQENNPVAPYISSLFGRVPAANNS